jgi:CDP-diglyceride synthetase
MTFEFLAAAKCLVLISAANSAPVVAKRFLGPRFDRPIDGGIILSDGNALLGKSKTWRGLAAAVFLSSLVAPILGLPWHAGALTALAAMAGDCLSSFVKRRLGLVSSSRALGLDQIPESLISAWVCSFYLPMGIADIALVVALFFAGEVVLSRLFFFLGLRDRPY